MNIKRTLFLLTGMPVMGLFASAALAGDADLPLDTAYASPVEGVTLKNQNDCPAGRFYKNQFPSLTNGTPGGSTTIVFDVDGKAVPMTVTWAGDNSFFFDLDGGIAYAVGVTVDTNNFLYLYGPPVVGDAGMNDYPGDIIAQDVNHLDLCLGTLDTEFPVVSITYPQDGGTAPIGTITVTATVTDNEGLSSVTASVEGGSLTDPIDLGEGTLSDTVPNQYEWTWIATDLLPDFYKLTVTATDTATATATTTANTTIAVSNFELIITAASCVGFRLPDDPDEGEGCNPTGAVNIQVPPVNNFNDGPDGCDARNGEICTITGDLLKPDSDKVGMHPGTLGCPACASCPVDSFPDPRMEEDADGNWVPADFRPLDVFFELGLSADSPQFDPGTLILNEYTFGFPCIVIAKHNKNFPLNVGFPFWPNQDDPNTPEDEATGVVFAKTLFPERVVLPPDLRPECYDQLGNANLQEANQGGYSTTDKGLMFGGTAAVLTDACFNPARDMTRGKSFDISGIVEHGGIPFDMNDAASGYAVLDFKFERAQSAFDALFFAIDNADAAVDEFGAPCLRSGKISDVTRRANQARSQFNKFNVTTLGRALEDLGILVDVVRSQQDWCVIEENHAGDILSQAYGLLWRIEQIRTELIRIEGL